MSASRSTLLPFLYPVLFKPQSIVCRRSFAPLRRIRSRKPSPAPFHSSSIRARYGTANEPPPHLQETSKEESEEALEAKEATTPEGSEQNEAPEEVEELDPAPTTSETSTNSSTKPIEDPQTPLPPSPKVPTEQPLETVLHMPSPSETANKAPHLQAPPYVHHFDTYSLVKHLEGSGFSGAQSITVMKGVRALLTQNMGLAQDGLVSKSNVENESYLFSAACSELRTEIQNNRKAEMEKWRTERTQLQHEVDILNQKFSQDKDTLKDELKGLFDDRKMAVRMEQKKMENVIQELNYKITVALNSDARSEVEGLRWVLTRRAATALAISAVMILATLRYSSYMTQTQEKERKDMEKQNAENGGNGHDEGGNGSVRLVQVRAPEEAAGDSLIASEGGGRGFVSLG